MKSHIVGEIIFEDDNYKKEGDWLAHGCDDYHPRHIGCMGIEVMMSDRHVYVTLFLIMNDLNEVHKGRVI